MHKILFALQSFVLSLDLILEFSSFQQKSLLLESLPTDLKASITVLDSDLSKHSSFLKIRSSENLESPPYTSLFKVHKERTIQQKSLKFLSEVNGVKSIEVVEAENFWKKGFKGQGVRIAILDSGFNMKDRKQVNLKECINFTDEPNCEDSTGHGTAVASIIASLHPDCPGLAPEAEVYALKVFNMNQESQTSWFLEAFEYVKHNKIKILNLSNGGINFMDEPFVSKISELVAHGVVVVSAAGNDGPGFGTLSNPGDQAEVIGVGGLDETGLHVSEFSSRGPTLWEISGGMGRFKPDIVTYSTNIKVLYKGECVSKTGTSIATPLVSGAIALLDPNNYSPGVIKIALMEAADKLTEESIFEQGAGKMNITNASLFLNNDSWHLGSFPRYFDNRDKYFYPYSLQPLHLDSPPIVLNFTIFHPVKSEEKLVIESVKGQKEISVLTEATDFKSFTSSLSVFIYSSTATRNEKFKIVVRSGGYRCSISFYIAVGARPVKSKRVLWDLTHNLKFPESGAVIRDELDGSYLLDWRGDHPFTNHIELYEQLVQKNYVVDLLLSDFSCIDGELYSTYLIIDPEKYFSDYQIKKIQYDLSVNQVNLIIFADWADSKTLNEQLSKSNFQQGVAGCNVNTLNTLLTPYFIELSTSKSFSDVGRIGSNKISFSQGTEITRFPAGGYLITQVFQDQKISKFRDVGVIGMVRRDNYSIGISGDSSCLEASNVKYDCLWLVLAFLEYFQSGKTSWDSYRLPDDYDIHLEEEEEKFEYTESQVPLSRMYNLQCGLHENSFVSEFEAESHIISQKKIRVWAPLREIEPVDIVGVVYIAIILIFAFLFFILFYTRSKPSSSIRIRTLSI